MPSVFSAIPTDQWVASNELAFAVRDRHPVTPGHTLVIPRREVATWWDTTEAERRALLALIDEVKGGLDARGAPDGYNVGFNAGAAAGQTVGHLHVHVIPRRAGDMADPRGGVRHVIPEKGNYLVAMPDAEPDLDLVDAREDRLLSLELARSLDDPAFDRIDFVVSFVMSSGLRLVGDRLIEAVERGAAVRVLTTDYLHVTDADALAWLLDRVEAAAAGEVRGSFAARLFRDPRTSFHPKAYLFWSSVGERARGFVGSSNLSRSGINGGVEWNVGTSAVGLLRAAFDVLWDDPRNLPLTHDLVRAYRSTAPPPPAVIRAATGEAPEPPLQPVAPREIQRQALDALTATRAEGFDAGLVVLATGLGKTWLAAFDSTRPQFRRTLFVAHREEILRQSRDVYRRVRPDAELGLFMADERQPDADVVFASIQTLAGRLHEFRADEFDYVVVDEFHHAAAPSYRRALAHFAPKFLLGLTATPDRMDGADLLALCDDNLVFECSLVEGIDRGDLVPFVYRGIRDTVDYEPIPWRNGRFDPAMLAAAVETRERAQQALDEWRAHGEGPTLAFCCSIAHADFMRAYLGEHGVRAAAVHTGPGSDSRHGAVEDLASGAIDVLCTVDVFNEGVDIPAIGTVLMLRPTESPVVFLQQLGRGLRVAEGKDALQVIDFIGNHRSFLLKPRVLLGLTDDRPPTDARVREVLAGAAVALPPGCAVHFDVELIDVLGAFLRTGRGASAGRTLLADLCRSMAGDTGRRPTALQALRAGANPAVARPWFAFLDGLGMLSEEERAVVAEMGDVLNGIETEQVTKAYKLVTFQALLAEGALRTGTTLAAVSARAHRIIAGDPRLVSDARGQAMPDPRAVAPEAWARFWRKWPLEHLAKGEGALFRIDGDRFEPTFAVPQALGEIFDAMVAELVDWRLAAYLLRQDVTSSAITVKVGHNASGPILFPLDRRRYPQIPQGETDVVIEGEPWTLRFVKVAVNTGRPARPTAVERHLRDVLRDWFGDDAGASGTMHSVRLEQVDGRWTLRPDQLTAETSRAEAPPA